MRDLNTYYKFKINYRRTGSKKIKTKIISINKESPKKQDFGYYGYANNGFNFHRVDDKVTEDETITMQW